MLLMELQGSNLVELIDVVVYGRFGLDTRVHPCLAYMRIGIKVSSNSSYMSAFLLGLKLDRIQG